MKLRTLLSITVTAAFCCSGSLTLAQEKDKATPPELVTYYFVLLIKGPKSTTERTPEVEKLQAAHLANIAKLHDDGKLALAGPFMDGGNWRGLYIFKASSMDEAKALAETDPLVQAGRLTYEIHPWATKKGMLP